MNRLRTTLIAVALLGGCTNSEGQGMITITSSAFPPGAPIPPKHTGEGPDLSPPLAWSGVPPEAQQLALICDDPDAPTDEPWVHWVLYGLSPTRTRLDEGSNGGGLEGKNDFDKVGYGGPMPPKGHGVHHYHFRLYALKEPLAATAPGLTKNQLLAAMQGRILAQGELIGTYERK